jgi:hypothetical protein
MRLFKFRKFQKWAKDEGVSDSILVTALAELKQGLFDANLGSGLYKKRVARAGQGKSRGYRVLLAFREGNRCIFIFGFAKSEISNIDDESKKILQRLAQYYLLLDNEELKIAINKGDLIEVMI